MQIVFYPLHPSRLLHPFIFAGKYVSGFSLRLVVLNIANCTPTAFTFFQSVIPCLFETSISLIIIIFLRFNVHSFFCFLQYFHYRHKKAGIGTPISFSFSNMLIKSLHISHMVKTQLSDMLCSK